MKHFISDRTAKMAQGTLLMVVLVVVVAAGAFYAYDQGYINLNTGGGGGGGGWFPTPSPQQTPVSSGYSGILYLEVTDSVTGAGVTTATVTVDVVAAQGGLFNFISGPKDTKAQAANPQAMNSIWNEGTELILMTDCTGNPTGGLDYYSAMFYVKLADQASVYELDDVRCFEQVGSSPITYRINTAYATVLSQKVSKYQASNVYYWNIGKLVIYPRSAIATAHLYLTYNGADCASLTDGATWIDTDAEITANCTLTSDDTALTLNVISNTTNLGWGKPYFAVTQTGKIKEENAVVIVTTSMGTLIGVSKFQDNGWGKINLPALYSYSGFYKVIGRKADDGVVGTMFPTKGNKYQFSVDIPIDANAAAASTAYLFQVWIIDSQDAENVAIGSTTTTVPTAYGFTTSYGLGQMVHARALTTSSGAGATEMLRVYATTAS